MKAGKRGKPRRAAKKAKPTRGKKSTPPKRSAKAAPPDDPMPVRPNVGAAEPFFAPPPAAANGQDDPDRPLSDGARVVLAMMRAAGRPITSSEVFAHPSFAATKTTRGALGRYVGSLVHRNKIRQVGAKKSGEDGGTLYEAVGSNGTQATAPARQARKIRKGPRKAVRKLVRRGPTLADRVQARADEIEAARLQQLNDAKALALVPPARAALVSSPTESTMHVEVHAGSRLAFMVGGVRVVVSALAADVE